ncbi:MAG: hypothetical protein ACOY4L_08625 [Pseudomonadota bacterium]
MAIDEGFLEGAVETFDVGVPLGGFGVGMPTVEAEGLEGFREACLERRAVVGEQHAGFYGQQRQGGA